ncbi:AAA family ATPase [Parafilimonas sp.]|uniref:AAA family ATPase n=1 Tax=Parafilimonas sp. TaxID=1969739 RepID=UPI0039E7085A
MNKPLLIVVTGSPSTGKTTLAHILANKINCPLLSRDELKEGLINTLNLEHNQLDKSVDLHVYETFFETINLLISKGISMIVEAAFQDKLWKPKLLNLLDKAEIRIIICKTTPGLITVRFDNRLSNNPGREKFHGDQSIRSSNEKFISLTEKYNPVHINTPTLQVDTTDNYNPAIEAIISFIKKNNC